MSKCQNCYQKEVELIAEIKVDGKIKKVCEECYEGYLITMEETTKEIDDEN